jgi:hypothetical protein
MLHGGMADFEDFGFFQRHYARRSRFAGEERHLAEEIPSVNSATVRGPPRSEICTATRPL